MNEKKSLTKENTNNETISKLIESIQSKLNNELDTSNNKDIINNNDLSSVKNKNVQNDTNENLKPTSNFNFDLGSLIGLLSKMNLNSNSNNNTNTEEGFNFSNLDPKLFSKIQKIVLTLGKKDPKKDLLISLKPFLRKSRQDKLGEYITILTIIKAFEAFNDKGSDENE